MENEREKEKPHYSHKESFPPVTHCTCSAAPSSAHPFTPAPVQNRTEMPSAGYMLGRKQVKLPSPV